METEVRILLKVNNIDELGRCATLGALAELDGKPGGLAASGTRPQGDEALEPGKPLGLREQECSRWRTDGMTGLRSPEGLTEKESPLYVHCKSTRRERENVEE